MAVITGVFALKWHFCYLTNGPQVDGGSRQTHDGQSTETTAFTAPEARNRTVD